MRQLPIISELFRNIHVRYACIKEKMALFSKFRAIQRWNPNKQHTNLKIFRVKIPPDNSRTHLRASATNSKVSKISPAWLLQQID